MYLLIVFLPLIGSSLAGFFGRFLGSEGSAPTGISVILSGIVLLLTSLLLGLFRISLAKHYGRKLVLVLYACLFFLIHLYFGYSRLYTISLCSFFLMGLFSNEGGVIFSMVSGSGGQIIPHSSPDTASSEDSFGIRVLSEPWPVIHNESLESSIRNRILALENAKTIFLLDDQGGYWNGIKTTLDQVPSQREYDHLLAFEARDLRIRELKHSCYSLFQEVLARHPDLAEQAPYNPEEVLVDFLDERRGELDKQAGEPVVERDRKEIAFLERLWRELHNNGPKTIQTIFHPALE